MTFPVKALSKEDNEYLVSWYQTTMAARKFVRISDQEEKTSERKPITREFLHMIQDLSLTFGTMVQPI